LTNDKEFIKDIKNFRIEREKNSRFFNDILEKVQKYVLTPNELINYLQKIS
jgi:hypothetical protein